MGVVGLHAYILISFYPGMIGVCVQTVFSSMYVCMYKLYHYAIPWKIAFCLFNRFSAGVAHSFTGSAEDRDKLLSFDNLFIGDHFKLYICALHIRTTFGFIALSNSYGIYPVETILEGLVLHGNLTMLRFLFPSIGRVSFNCDTIIEFPICSCQPLNCDWEIVLSTCFAYSTPCEVVKRSWSLSWSIIWIRKNASESSPNQKGFVSNRKQSKSEKFCEFLLSFTE